MTDRELMQQALEALTGDLSNPDWDGLVASLRERLAQPYCDDCGGTDPECPLGTHWEGCEEVHPECRKPKTVMAEYKFQTYAAYKTPDGEMKIGVVPETRREWVGLTDREIEEIARYQDEHGSGPWHLAFARAIKAKLKEKNA